MKEIILFNSSNDEVLDWENMVSEISAQGMFVMQGSVGRWNGNCDAGTIVYDFEDFIYAISKDIDNWLITAKGNTIKILASHHDGTSVYYLKPLNQLGIDLVAEYEDSDYCGFAECDRKFHAKLFNSRKYIKKLEVA